MTNPNETLRRIREAVAYLALPPLETDRQGVKESYDVLREDIAALDEWLSKGGFLPDAWAKAKEQGALLR